MFPLIPLLIVGGYWLSFNGWARVSNFSPTNPLGSAIGGVSGVVGTLVNPTLTQDQISNETSIIGKWVAALNKSGLLVRNPAAKAQWDASVKPKVQAFTASPTDVTFGPALSALSHFFLTYGIKGPGA